jgi:hypothetical protein
MKTLKLFLLPVLESFEFTWQVIHYALIFVSAFFRQRASLGCSIEEEVKRKTSPLAGASLASSPTYLKRVGSDRAAPSMGNADRLANCYFAHDSL